MGCCQQSVKGSSTVESSDDGAWDYAASFLNTKFVALRMGRAIEQGTPGKQERIFQLARCNALKHNTPASKPSVNLFSMMLNDHI